MVLTVCGSEVDKDDPNSESVIWTYEGKEYFFCESDCLKEFLHSKDKAVWLEGHK